MLGDVIVAEPKALIGFAGPRVIEQTVREKLPEGFQRSEFLLAHGAIDMIIPRVELRPRVASVLRQLMGVPTTPVLEEIGDVDVEVTAIPLEGNSDADAQSSSTTQV